MSAGIDLTNQVVQFPSAHVRGAAVGDTPASGVVIGLVADMRDVNMLSHVICAFGNSTSGQFKLQVQTSPDTNSGNFTDPTSGLLRMTTNLLSGGILVVNSGNNQASGGFFRGGFLRPADHRYARVNIMSGDQFNASVQAGLEAWAKRTGSGPGYSFSPASGASGFAGVGGF